MSDKKSNSWDIPVAFYFRVTFTINGSSHQCSFTSVEGLGQTLDYKEQAQQGDNVIWLPEKVTHNDITLKRALETTPDTIDKWIKDCFKFATTGELKPCKLRIDLLDSKVMKDAGAVDDVKALATWNCNNVVPKSWTIDTLNAQESKVVIQTLVLKNNGFE